MRDSPRRKSKSTVIAMNDVQVPEDGATDEPVPDARFLVSGWHPAASVSDDMRHLADEMRRCGDHPQWSRLRRVIQLTLAFAKGHVVTIAMVVLALFWLTMRFR